MSISPDPRPWRYNPNKPANPFVVKRKKWTRVFIFRNKSAKVYRVTKFSQGDNVTIMCFLKNEFTKFGNTWLDSDMRLVKMDKNVYWEDLHRGGSVLYVKNITVRIGRFMVFVFTSLSIGINHDYSKFIHIYCKMYISRIAVLKFYDRLVRLEYVDRCLSRVAISQMWITVITVRYGIDGPTARRQMSKGIIGLKSSGVSAEQKAQTRLVYPMIYAERIRERERIFRAVRLDRLTVQVDDRKFHKQLFGVFRDIFWL